MLRHVLWPAVRRVPARVTVDGSFGLDGLVGIVEEMFAGAIAAGSRRNTHRTPGPAARGERGPGARVSGQISCHLISAMPWPSGSRKAAAHSSMCSPRATGRGRWMNFTSLVSSSA